MLLFDTHVWLWSVEDDGRHLGHSSRRAIERAGARDAVRVSPVSLFEVTALHVAGRVHLRSPIEQWIRDALQHVRIADVTAQVAVDAGHIPRTTLPDPMDRMLVATARQLDATFVTADRAILTYARGGHVRVQDASR